MGILLLKLTMKLKSLGLILSGLIILSQNNIAQNKLGREPVLSGLHTLSIHVRDTVTHDSVYHFLVDKLKLPVYYYPVTYGARKYVGTYAGNLVLEPCGPYSDYRYASSDFRAVFFGLTFEPFKTLSQPSNELTARGINCQAGGNFIIFSDSALCGDNIVISFMDDVNKVNGKNRKIDSLKSDLAADTYNELGIEYVSEIVIGYRDNAGLKKWKELISPAELKNAIWNVSDLLDFHIVKSNIREVQSITFKVKSLEKARLYLIKNSLAGSFSDNKIGLDRSKAFGLSIYLSE